MKPKIRTIVGNNIVIVKRCTVMALTVDTRRDQKTEVRVTVRDHKKSITVRATKRQLINVYQRGCFVEFVNGKTIKRTKIRFDGTDTEQMTNIV